MGGGIVGTAAALRLVLRGHAVTLFEPNVPGAAASFGNSGHIGTASIIPWASPGNFRNSLSMMRDPLHPLHAPPAGLVVNARWFLGFARAARPEAFDHGTRTLASLVSTAWQDISLLIETVSAGSLVSDAGVLQVYLSPQSFAASRREREIRRRYGIEAEEISADEARRLEPALGPSVAGGVLVPGVRRLRDPQALAQRMFEGMLERGGAHVARAVKSIETASDGRPAIVVDGAPLAFDRVVLAAGIGSKPFLKQLGVTVPLAGERGFHLEMRSLSGLITRAVANVDKRVMYTSTLHGLRMTTGADFSPLSAPVRYERARRIFEASKALFPALHDLHGQEWSGLRPSTPDSLPIIGMSPRIPGVVIATGHGHTGVGMSGMTARLVEALVEGRDTDIDLSAIAPDRSLRRPAAAGRS